MNANKTVWLVGQMDDELFNLWALQGIFETEEEAVAKCRYINQFVAPFDIGSYMAQGYLTTFYYPARKERA